MAPWFCMPFAAAVLYGAHQIFTRLASDHIGMELAVLSWKQQPHIILLYLAFLWLSGRWNQKFSAEGFNYSH